MSFISAPPALQPLDFDVEFKQKCRNIKAEIMKKISFLYYVEFFTVYLMKPAKSFAYFRLLDPELRAKQDK